MAKVKHTARQKATTRRNLSKGPVTRVGRRGMHYKPRQISEGVYDEYWNRWKDIREGN